MAQFSNLMALIRHASNWIRTVFHIKEMLELGQCHEELDKKYIK
jgi:hypothetical protein